MAIRSLSFHAGYRCRHSGACCTSGWPIPVEADRLDAAERAIAAGRLRTCAPVTPFVRTPQAPAETPAIVGTTAAGTCVFYRTGQLAFPADAPSFDRAGPGREDGGCCAWHRAMGHEALPLACRQFPRVSVTDPRGTSVTLSHYCPTAAALLEEPGPLAIVTAPPAFPEEAEYVGLDARTSLPPQLRPDMLMGWEDWWDWEARSVAVIAHARDVDTALDALSLAVEHACAWTPAEGPLRARIDEAFARADAALRAGGRPDVAARRAADRPTRIAEVFASVPAELRPDPGTLAGALPSPHARRRYLAAHAFANWTACLGDGLRCWLRSIEAADALVTSGYSVRTADLLLRHLSDPFAYARRI